MKLLIIDCKLDTDSIGSEDLRKMFAPSGAIIEVRRAPNQDLPNIAHDGVIISGSRQSCVELTDWAGALETWIKNEVIAKKTPCLGICFGMQMLARAYGGAPTVGLLPAPENGWVQITPTPKNHLFKNIQRPEIVFSAHREAVVQLPPGFLATAYSNNDCLQAMEHASLPHFGLQFHPEKTWTDAQHSIAQWKKSLPQQKVFGINTKESEISTTFPRQLCTNFINSFR